MGESRLVQVLKFLGFYCVYSLQEKVSDETRIIHKGVPMSWDFSSSSGTTVVYDDDGLPWIRPGFIDPAILGEKLIHGAYIPFIRDGGAWLSNTFPKVRLYVMGNTLEMRIPAAVALIFRARATEIRGDITKATGMLNTAGLIEDPAEPMHSKHLMLLNP